MLTTAPDCATALLQFDTALFIANIISRAAAMGIVITEAQVAVSHQCVTTPPARLLTGRASAGRLLQDGSPQLLVDVTLAVDGDANGQAVTWQPCNA